MIFKLVGQGGLSKKALDVQEDSRCKGIQGNTSKSEIKCVCLKLNFSQYPAIHTNYIISHCTTL